ncbi:MAG: helix-turn-helix domain-containing protein [Nitrospirae bacterium]|nr:helix-turn-helix domain-containing protein [Nitrospirota bacterium]MCL5238075.1 helix-turn-helix domain-containing protein [Nitrospirota bacterium]
MQKKKVTTSKDIGERIKERRKELKISQEELAEILGVTYQQVQRYENGTNKLNVENIQRIANALSAPLSYFFEVYKMPVIAEEQAHYATPAENKLLRHFRKIRNSNSQNIVIQIARLAAKSD